MQNIVIPKSLLKSRRTDPMCPLLSVRIRVKQEPPVSVLIRQRPFTPADGEGSQGKLTVPDGHGYEPIKTDTNRSSGAIHQHAEHCDVEKPLEITTNRSHVSIAIGSHPCQAGIACFRSYPSTTIHICRWPRISEETDCS